MLRVIISHCFLISCLLVLGHGWLLIGPSFPPRCRRWCVQSPTSASVASEHVATTSNLHGREWKPRKAKDKAKVTSSSFPSHMIKASRLRANTTNSETSKAKPWSSPSSTNMTKSETSMTKPLRANMTNSTAMSWSSLSSTNMTKSETSISKPLRARSTPSSTNMTKSETSTAKSRSSDQHRPVRTPNNKTQILINNNLRSLFSMPSEEVEFHLINSLENLHLSDSYQLVETIWWMGKNNVALRIKPRVLKAYVNKTLSLYGDMPHVSHHILLPKLLVGLARCSANCERIVIYHKNMLLGALEETLPLLQAQGLVNSLHSLGVMDMKYEDFSPSLIETLYRVMIRNIPYYNHQHLSNTLWGLYMINVPWQSLPIELRDEIIHAIERLQCKFTPQAIGNTIYALGKIGCHRDLLPSKTQNAIQVSIEKCCEPTSRAVFRDITHILQGLSNMDFTWESLKPTTTAALNSALFDLFILTYRYGQLCSEDMGTFLITLSRMDVSWASLPTSVRSIIMLSLIIENELPVSGVDDEMYLLLSSATAMKTTTTATTTSLWSDNTEDHSHNSAKHRLIYKASSFASSEKRLLRFLSTEDSLTLVQKEKAFFSDIMEENDIRKGSPAIIKEKRMTVEDELHRLKTMSFTKKSNESPSAKELAQSEAFKRSLAAHFKASSKSKANEKEDVIEHSMTAVDADYTPKKVTTEMEEKEIRARVWANMVYSMSKIDGLLFSSLRSKAQEKVFEGLLSALDHFVPQGLSTSLYGLAKLDVHHSQLPRSLVNKILIVVEDYMAGIDQYSAEVCQQVSNIICAFGYMGIYFTSLPMSLQNEIERVIAVVLTPKMRFGEISGLTYALSKAKLISSNSADLFQIEGILEDEDGITRIHLSILERLTTLLANARGYASMEFYKESRQITPYDVASFLRSIARLRLRQNKLKYVYAYHQGVDEDKMMFSAFRVLMSLATLVAPHWTIYEYAMGVFALSRLGLTWSSLPVTLSSALLDALSRIAAQDLDSLHSEIKPSVLIRSCGTIIEGLGALNLDWENLQESERKAILKLCKYVVETPYEHEGGVESRERNKDDDHSSMGKVVTKKVIVDASLAGCLLMGLPRPLLRKLFG